MAKFFLNCCKKVSHTNRIPYLPPPEIVPSPHPRDRYPVTLVTCRRDRLVFLMLSVHGTVYINCNFRWVLQRLV